MMSTNCPCGNIFEQKDKGRPRKYCSDRCRNKFCRPQFSYICKNCGKVFYDRKRDRDVQFCSHKCHAEYTKYSEEQMILHVCQICDEEFYRLPGDSNPNLFCSKRCQLIHVSSKSRVFTEEKFEMLLKRLNIKYEIQHKYDKYYADFYLPHLNLLLELDGRTFHSSESALIRDMQKSKVAFSLGYNMIRVWCSRSKEISKLERAVSTLLGDDLAEFISAIPKGMINSVNLVKGCDINSIANGENLTMDNAVPSIEGNFFEGVETKVESKDKIMSMTIKYLNSSGHC